MDLGSGILSIVSKLNWANNVVGAEIDKKAIANSIQNCKLNNIHISFIDLNEKTIQKKYDILIANILAETLIQLSNSFKKLTRKNLVLCGILDKQVPKIIDTYSEWIILENKKNMDGWNLLEGNYSFEKYNLASAITFGDNKIVPIIVGITIKA